MQDKTLNTKLTSKAVFWKQSIDIQQEWWNMCKPDQHLFWNVLQKNKYDEDLTASKHNQPQTTYEFFEKVLPVPGKVCREAQTMESKP